jgi:hypothetical protein
MTDKKEIDEVSVFYRDLLVKIMGFGLVVFLLVAGWLLETEDTEKFDWFWNGAQLEQKAENIAIVYAAKGTPEYKIKLFEMKKALEMRWDRTIGLLMLPVGTVLWIIATSMAKIKAGKHSTVFSWGVVVVYCVVISLPQFIFMYLIFKD